MKGIEKVIDIAHAANLGMVAAEEILTQGGQGIVDNIRKNGLTANGPV
jgi:phosphoribosylamine-glycine ligase